MSKILKKLFRRPGVLALMEEYERLFGALLWVMDQDGNPLFGSRSDGEARGVPVRLEKEVIGRVGRGKAAPLVAALLEYLAAEEQEKRSLIRETLDRYKEINLLYNVAERITTSLALKRVGSLVLDEAIRCIRGNSASVMLMDAETNRFNIIAARGRESANKVRLEPGKGIAGHVFNSGKAEIVNEMQEDDRYLSGEHPVRSIICAPLKIADRIIGVMTISSDDPLQYTASELKLFNTLASFAASAIENSLTHEALERAFEELKALNRAKDKMIDHLSHELKTPIAVLGSVLEIVSKKSGAAGITGIEKSLERGRRNLDRLVRIEDQVADIVNTREVIQLVPIPLTDFLEEICRGAEAAMGSRMVEILRGFAPEALLYMDRIVLEKICAGMLKNGVENTPDEGRIIVESLENPDGICIRFHDFGTGIIEENRSLIFGGFYHVQETSRYSSGRPYAFNAGGSGSDLLRAHIFSERFGFSIELKTRRCPYLPTEQHICPGRISACSHVPDRQACLSSGETIFSLLFQDPVFTKGPFPQTDL